MAAAATTTTATTVMVVTTTFAAAAAFDVDGDYGQEDERMPGFTRVAADLRVTATTYTRQYTVHSRWREASTQVAVPSKAPWILQETVRPRVCEGEETCKGNT